MRRTVLAVVCLLVCFAVWGVPANAKVSTDPSVPASAGEGQYGYAQESSAQQQDDNDPDRPVLKRRPKTGPDARTDESQQSEPQQDNQNAGQGSTNPAANTDQGDQNAQQNAGQQQSQPAASSGPVLTQRVPAPTHFPAGATIPLNTQFQVALDETLSSKRSHPGDSFTATLDEPLQSSHGDTLVPSGSKVLGTVQEAESGKVFASMRGKGRLVLRFDTVVLPDGRRLPMQTTLLSIGPNKTKASVNQEGQITSGTRAGEAVKKVAVGAGVGTIAGMIFGSTLKGTAIGAIAGGGYAMAQAGKDVELPARTTVNLRLDQYLVVAQH
ncbi:MAG TPA: hypothetical protein VFU86_06680 [Terriglobales bacterium]|nr:hypothetical protein [Terriglobales bacterium]